MDGEVRCGICAKIFNARYNLVEKAKTGKLATEQAAQAKSKQAESYHQKINASDLEVSHFPSASDLSKISQAQFETKNAEAGQQMSPNLDTQASQLNPPPPAVDDLVHSDTDACLAADLENEDSLATTALISKKILLLSISAVILFSIISIFLYGYLSRDNLAQHAEYRSWLTTMCHVVGCELPLFKDIANIEIINKDIRTHPSNPHTLLVRASFINNAVFPQQYPTLKVNLYDFNKIDVASRHFGPLDYLPKGTEIARGFFSNSRIVVELEMLDADEAAVGYEISFQ